MAFAFEPRVLMFANSTERLAHTLEHGVLAYDLSNAGVLYIGNGTLGGVPVVGGTGGSPGGGTGSVQFKTDTGSFGGGSGLIYDVDTEVTKAQHLIAAKTVDLSNAASFAPSVTQVNNIGTAEVGALQDISVLNIDPNSQSGDPLFIHGIEAPEIITNDGGRILIIRNLNSTTNKKIALVNMSGSGTPGNKINLGQTTFITKGSACVLMYDATDPTPTNRVWRLCSPAGTTPHTHDSAAEGGYLNAATVFSTSIVPVANGGTGFGGGTPYTKGDIIYASSTTALAKLSPAANKVLYVNNAGDAPVYKTPVQVLTQTWYSATGVAANEDRTLIYATQTIVITAVRAHKLGSATSVSFNLVHHAQRDSISGLETVFSGSQSCTSNSGQTFNSGFSSQEVAAGKWLWVNLDTISGGTLGMFHVTVEYYLKD